MGFILIDFKIKHELIFYIPRILQKILQIAHGFFLLVGRFRIIRFY